MWPQPVAWQQQQQFLSLAGNVSIPTTTSNNQQPPGGSENSNDWAMKAAQWAQQKKVNDQYQLMQQHAYLQQTQYHQQQPFSGQQSTLVQLPPQQQPVPVPMIVQPSPQPVVQQQSVYQQQRPVFQQQQQQHVYQQQQPVYQHPQQQQLVYQQQQQPQQQSAYRQQHQLFSHQPQGYQQLSTGSLSPYNHHQIGKQPHAQHQLQQQSPTNQQHHPSYILNASQSHHGQPYQQQLREPIEKPTIQVPTARPGQQLLSVISSIPNLDKMKHVPVSLYSSSSYTTPSHFIPGHTTPIKEETDFAKPLMKDVAVSQKMEDVSLEIRKTETSIFKEDTVEVPGCNDKIEIADEPVKIDNVCEFAPKKIPGLDLVLNTTSSYVVHKQSTRGSLENNLQSAYPQETMVAAQHDSRGQEPNQVIKSLGKIVSQLQALQNTSKNMEFQVVESGAASKGQKLEKDYYENPVTSKPFSVRKEDETRRKVAALIENETDSEGEDQKPPTDGYQSPSLDSREFSGFDTGGSTMRNREHDSRSYMYSGKGNDGSSYSPYYGGSEKLNQSFIDSQYQSRPDSRTHPIHQQHQSEIFSPNIKQSFVKSSRSEFENPIHQRDYHSHPRHDSHMSLQNPFQTRDISSVRDPPITNDAYQTRRYHEHSNPHISLSPDRRYPQPAQTYNEPVYPLASGGYRDEGYDHSYSSEYDQYNFQSSRLSDRNTQSSYHDDNIQYGHNHPPQSSFPPADYQHEGSSTVLSNIQSVDYDHGRVYNTGCDEPVNTELNTAMFSIPNLGTALNELRNKSLPIWLRKELEELELKKFKEAEQKAEIREGENTVRGSWWEELEDDNEIEREVMENDSPPKYRKRIRMTDSPPEREITRESDHAMEKKPAISEDIDDDEKLMHIITRVRQLLTEILLDVTDSEMESISKEVLFNEKSSEASLPLEECQVLSGLNVYDSPSDATDITEKSRSSSQTLDPAIVAAAFRGNYSDDSPVRKRSTHGKPKKSKWDSQDVFDKDVKDISSEKTGVVKSSKTHEKKSLEPSSSDRSRRQDKTHSSERRESSKSKRSHSSQSSDSKTSSKNNHKDRSHSKEKKERKARVKDSRDVVSTQSRVTSSYTRVVSIDDSSHAHREKKSDKEKDIGRSKRDKRHHEDNFGEKRPKRLSSGNRSRSPKRYKSSKIDQRVKDCKK